MKRKLTLGLGIVFMLIIFAGCSVTEIKYAFENPSKKVDSVDVIADQLGFTPVTMPESTGFKLDKCYVVGERIAELRYKNDDGHKATIRSELGSDDKINGIVEADYNIVAYRDVQFFMGQVQDKDTWAGYHFGKSGDKTITYGAVIEGSDRDGFMYDFVQIIQSANQ